MPDAIFADPRLAQMYDHLDAAERVDLDPYVAMVDEFAAHLVVDVGCGTGVLACRLAGLGKSVVGVDPAAASLAVARRRPFAGRVRWICAAASDLPTLGADLAVMTGKVAQVFLTDEDWSATLAACRAALRPGGRLVFEVRDPAREAWRRWTRESSYRVVDVPAAGAVETWFDLVAVRLPLVSFRHTFVFRADGAVLTSDSTLRFRSRDEVADSLAAAGFTVEPVRDAPDRPGLELVFVARR